ncbi:MAG: amidohydrolase [Ignavibacteria bacterium]|nr:amidohydrolase [Ignavibacteria bacterium]
MTGFFLMHIMKPIQAIITIERGRIIGIEPMSDGVTIISEQGIHTYPGAYVLPGLVDAHCHFHALGELLNGLRLYNLYSKEETIHHCKQHIGLRGDWLYGMGWNQELWKEAVYPYAGDLDAIFPDTPVYLRRADGHAAWVNSKAMECAGITDSTPDPEGGTIIREHGKATGILIDNAMDIVAHLIPELTKDMQINNILTAAKHCSSLGLTEVHDMDVHPSLLPICLELAENGLLPIRIQSFIKAQQDQWIEHGCLPAGGEFVRIAGLKFFVDGALGSRGAAMIEPYADADHNGLILMDEETLFQKAKRGIEEGFSIATHAIGDMANRIVINAYERLRKDGIADADVILRIEHTQIIRMEDIIRMNEYAIKAIPQSVHCISDAPMAKTRLGRRASIAYPWKSLINHGLHPAGSSDFPIESANPLVGIDAYCRRIPFQDNSAWMPEEIISQEEAISSYTSWAHEAAGMEYRRGSIELKFDADLTILNTDIASCPVDDILHTQVLATYTAGIRRYHAE